MCITHISFHSGNFCVKWKANLEHVEHVNTDGRGHDATDLYCVLDEVLGSLYLASALAAAMSS